MNKLGLFLKSAPFTSARGNTLLSIAKAAIDKGIQVTVFLDLDGVLQVLNTQKSLEILEVPNVKFSDLVEKGAIVYVCNTCLNERGLFDPELFNQGIRIGTTEEIAGILGDVDKLVTL